jgi:hypothetical protein
MVALGAQLPMPSQLATMVCIAPPGPFVQLPLRQTVSAAG